MAKALSRDHINPVVAYSELSNMVWWNIELIRLLSQMIEAVISILETMSLTKLTLAKLSTRTTDR